MQPSYVQNFILFIDFFSCLRILRNLTQEELLQLLKLETFNLESQTSNSWYLHFFKLTRLVLGKWKKKIGTVSDFSRYFCDFCRLNLQPIQALNCKSNLNQAYSKCICRSSSITQKIKLGNTSLKITIDYL